MIARSLLSHRVRAAFAALILLSLVTQARAHFLFIRIGPPAEAGRSAEVFFSEQAEAGDPKFVGKIAHTTLWIQTRPGEFRELPTKQAVDRLRASLPSDRTLAVVGKCEYGVLARPKETPFLLRYYPKAVAGNADELNRLKPNREIPFEIQANFENQATNSDKTAAGRIRLVALRNGKVVPNALFTAVDSDLSEQTIKADSDGSARWSPAAPGRYSVYVRDTLKEPGVLGDKKYDEIREFATLALNWPLERHDADSNATALFKEAIAHRAEWREFPGFTAELSGHVDGRPFAGTATVKNNGAVEIQTDDPVAKSWLQDQLDSLVMHRIAQASESADAHQPRLRFADDDDDHPLGRLLAVDGDQMGSSYRIKNQQITVVIRRMGKQNMTITVLDSDKNADGRFLPHSYVVHYWDAATGKLNRVETFQERSLRVGSWDLPVLRSIVTASDSGLSVKVVNLSKHALLKTN
jgi:hypothetical protein